MARRITVDQQWECQLSASPERVLEGDEVTLTVTLAHPKLGGELQLAGNSILYGGLSYHYDAKDPRLKKAIEKAVVGKPAVNQAIFIVPKLPDGSYEITVTVTAPSEILEGINEELLQLIFQAPLIGSTTIDAVTQQIEAQATVTLQRSASSPTDDQALWVAIRNRTAALDFTRYQKFIDCLFCDELSEFDVSNGMQKLRKKHLNRCLDPDDNRPLSIYGPYAYNVLKLATQAFLTLECGVVIREGKRDGHTLFGPGRLFDIEKERIRLGDPSISIEDLKQRLSNYLIQFDNQASVLPYLGRIVTALVGLDRDDVEEVLPYCYGILQHRLTCPSLLELIWSYWHEEGMLVQTMNTIALRFQNRRSSPHDPLGELELDPLRPLNNLLWGFIQDEHNRLTVPRRAYEYQHHYGLTLVGRAVTGLTPADSRSKFIEAFHNLLYRVALFYREDADTTVIADAFPLLNALKEVHLLLAEGAHNQFGDLPWTSRGEMLMMQWLLARPEMREFLRGRYMVPYQEAWMGAVDSMKKLQGWTDTTVTHFHELAVTGERILLSIRYGDWVDIENIEEQAKNWARYWKPEIQRYLHGYLTVTGVDLMVDITDTREAATRFLQPSVLLQRRLTQQTSQRALPTPRTVGILASETAGLAELPMPSRSRMLK